MEKKIIIRKIDTVINNKNFHKYDNFILSYNFGDLKKNNFFFVKDIKSHSINCLSLNLKYSLLLMSYKTEKNMFNSLEKADNKSVVVYLKIKHIHLKLIRNIKCYVNLKKKSVIFFLKLKDFCFFKNLFL